MAIAFDAATDGGNNGGTTTSRTFAHTCTGADRILFVGVKAGDTSAGDLVTGATYNGVSMTLVAKRTPGVLVPVGGDGNRWIYLFVLPNPASGANNVVVSSSANVYIIAGAVSYTGAANSAVDASTQGSTAGTGSGSSITLTLTLTTVADNCWTMAVFGGYEGGILPTAGAGTTRRAADAAFGTWGLFDSNAAITPAGSTSLTGTYAADSGSGENGVMASFAPVTAGALTNLRRGRQPILQAVNRAATY